MRQQVWITLRLPINVDSRARYHRDDVLDPEAQGQGARGSGHLTNQIVSVRIELPSLIDKPTMRRQYLPPPYLTT
jgi:hypothetical protein